MKTNQKILSAALQILTEHGFHALTQTRVADEAGVSQGNLTYHFPTRTDLLKAVVDVCKAQMCSSRLVELSEGPITWEGLENFMMGMPFSKNMPHLMLALTVARDEDPSISDWFANHNLSSLQNLQGLLASLGVQADESVLHFVRAAVVGAALIHVQQGSPASEQIARGIVKNACHYLKQQAVPLSI